MTVRSKLALGLAAGALVIGSASPAAAGGRYGPWGGYGHRGYGHGHGHGDGAAAVIGVLLGVGLIAAIASANDKAPRQVEQRTYDPREPEEAPRYEEPSGGGASYDDRTPDQRSYESGQAGFASEDEAVDACAIAARDQAAQGGGFAEIRDITGVRSWGSGYDVTGVIDQRSSYRATDRRARSFRCTFDNGQVAGVSFGASV